VLAPAAAAAVLLGLFALWEGRIATDPLIPLDVFRRPLWRSANLVMALLYAAVFAMWFFVSLYLQDVRGLDALDTGLSFLPMTLGFFAASSLSPRLITRFGATNVLSAGLAVTAVGLALLAEFSSTGSPLAAVLAGGMVATLGMGTALVPVMIVSVQGVEPHETGLASGLINTSRLVGGALGLAALSTIAVSYTHSRADAGASELVALSDGYRLAFLVGAALAIAAAGVAATMLRRNLLRAENAAAERHSRSALPQEA
jgi:predicted MFS family arabinose efflux permease